VTVLNRAGPRNIFPDDAPFEARVALIMRTLDVCKREAEVALLHLEAGLGEDDMAHRLGCRKGTIHEWRRRLRAKLRIDDARMVGPIVLAVLWRSASTSESPPFEP
jgi:hypothetical protein